jgi:hypothetical protein
MTPVLEACDAIVGAGDRGKAAFDYFIEFAVTMPLLSVAAVAPDDMPQVNILMRAKAATCLCRLLTRSASRT